MSDNRTDLPSPSAPNFNQRLRETIQTYLGRQGNPLDRGLTLRDLTETGLLKLRDGFTLKPGSGSSTLPLEPGPGLADEPDLTPPPTPTGLTATAAISHIIIEHDAPIYTQGRGHLRTRLYGKIVNTGDPLPTFADAVEIAQFDGTVYAHPSNPATTWRFWIKWETIDNVLSIDPAGGTNGVEAITGQDVSKLVLAMTGPGNPFKVVTEQLTLPDGTVVPAGTYTADAFIQNGQITNAKIANLAVDSAKIASVSADKITAGSIAVGRYIQSAGYVAGESGWRINGDGSAEFSNVTVRGTVYASAGQFSGTLLGGSAGSYSSGDGFYAGPDNSVYKWRVGDPSGSRVQWTGSSIEVYNSDNQLTISSGGVVGLSDKLDKASNTILNVATSGTTYVAGLRVGNLAWDSSGNRTSGKGIALTPKGILGHNGSKVTFSVDADTGDAFFGGSLEVGVVSASSLYAYQSNSTSLLNETGFGFTLPLSTTYKWNGGKIVLAFRVMIATGRLSGVAWIKPNAAIYVNGNTAYSYYELGNLPAPPSSNAISFSYVTVDSQMLEFNSAGTNNSLSAYINVDFYSSSGAVVANTADVSAFVNAEVSILEVKV